MAPMVEDLMARASARAAISPFAASEAWEAGGDIPLPESQSGIWYAQRLAPANPIFNTGQYAELAGPLDVEAFRFAVDEAMREADALAVRVEDSPDGPRLRRAPGLVARLEVFDLRGEPDPARAARGRMRDDMRTARDLARESAVAQQLFILGRERHFWYQRIHHLVVDGYGTALLNARVGALYASRLSSAPAGAPFAPFANVLDAEAEYLRSGRRAVDREYWLSEFEGRPAPASLSRGVASSGTTFRRRRAALPAATSDAMSDLAARAGAAWPDALLTLVAAYLCRHTGGGDSVLGAPLMNRLGSPAARVPAMVMNVLPVRVSVDEDLPTHELVRRVSARMREARKHGRFRGEQLRRELGLLGDLRRLHGPLVNVLPFDAELVLPGVAVRLHTLGTGPVDDLTINVLGGADAGSLRLVLDANPELYGIRELESHTARLAAFLSRAAAAESLAAVATITEAERRRVHAVNSTAHVVEDSTLAALVELAMRRSPDSIALIADGREVSYAELDALSVAHAARLAHAGVRRGDVVAVAGARSVELVSALVAVIRLGAAYLPVDPGHPPSRVASMFESSPPRAVVAARDARSAIPGDAFVLELEDAPTPAPAHGIARDVAVDPDDAAYVIFTSGSTGAPKGVVVGHRAIVNRLSWMREHYGIGADDRILHKTPFTFDVSVWELFLPLISGATMVLAPPGAEKDPARLAELVRAEGITTLHFVPSMLALFLEEPGARGLAPRRVFCSGEALTPALRDRFHGVLRSELHNLYGPTEAAVDVSHWEATRDDASAPVPIGWPVWNTTLCILDDRLRLVPPGVEGELCIAGAQLAHGYAGRADLTAERFVPAPAELREAGLVEGEARVYRTGDRARRREDGAIEFLGRADGQVKIRGQRVELEEIEAAIAACGVAAQAAVTVREDRPGDQRVAAYLVPRRGGAAAAPDVASLRTRLARSLPDYMLPSALVVLEALPATSSGKVDRGALPAPEEGPSAASRGRAPGTLTERRVAAHFAAELGLSNGAVCADDDFFELGGHSLLAARVVARLREDGTPGVELASLFANPTAARLAAWLDAREGVADGEGNAPGMQPVIRLGDGRDAPGGTRAGTALFCVHPAGGLSWCYATLARALGPDVAVYGLQARGLDLRAPLPATLDEMAANYLLRMRAVKSTGPYHLAGWSLGGIVAQAMAVRLAAAGEDVGVVALLDAYPSDLWRDSPEPDEGAALKALLHIAGHETSAVSRGPLTRPLVVEFLRRVGHPLGALSDDLLEGLIRVVESNNRLVREHRHERFPGTLHHFRAALDHSGDSLFPRQWEQYAARVEVHEVPALHAHMTGVAASGSIASVLGEALGIRSRVAAEAAAAATAGRACRGSSVARHATRGR